MEETILQLQQYRGNRVFYASVLAACLNGVAVGNVAGWSQSAIPQLLSPSYMFMESQASWIAGIMYLGMLVGGFISIGIVHRFGKRFLFLLGSVPSFLGWIIIAIAANFWQFILGRIISGIGTGMICYHTELYLSEISPRLLRSKISVVFAISINVGVLLSYTIGPALTISTATSVYMAVVLILASLYLTVAPETPFWLIKSTRTDDALENLRKLRGKPDVHEEFNTIVEFVKSSFVTDKTDGIWQNLKRLLCDKAATKAILLVFLLTTAQQFSGVVSINTYGQLIFERSVAVIPGRYVSCIIGLIKTFCAALCGCLVEHLRRRHLVACSLIICASCMVLMGIYYHGLIGNSNQDGVRVIPLACIIVFALAYGLGLATMPTVITAECLSMDARNVGAAVQNTTLCLSVLFSIKFWQVISTSYGQEYSFWMAGVINVVHMLVLLIILPETRGRSLIEIQRLLVSTNHASPSTQQPRESMMLWRV